MKSFSLSLILVLTPALALAQINFGHPVIPPGGGSPKSMAVGDFDGNGFEDVVVHSVTIPTLKTFYVDGNGNVTTKYIDVPGTGENRTYLMADDLNHDGKDDLLILGDGIFGILVCISTGTDFDIKKIPLLTYIPTLRATVIDFNDDGNLDILVAGKDLFVQLYTGDGTGNFTSSFLPVKTSFSGDDLDLHVVDLNNDMRKDLIVVSDQTVTTYVKGPGEDYITDTKSITGNLVRIYDQSRNSIVLDVDGNETLDIVTVTTVPDTNGDLINDGKVSFLSNNGDGTFAEPALIPTGTGTIITIDHADFDADGREDLAMGLQENFYNNLLVLHNIGGGGFENKSPGIPHWLGPLDVRFTNFDGDPTPDIVFLTGDQTLNWFKWDGSTWSKSKSVIFEANLADGHVYDIDGDGIKDIVGASFSGPSIAIWYGKGNLEYEEPVFIPINGEVPRSAVADFNGDGYGDIVYNTNDINIPNAQTDGRSIIFSTGPRTFAPAVKLYPNEASISKILSYDFDNDTDVDFVNTFGTYVNDGTGHFTFSLSGIPVTVYSPYQDATTVGHFNHDEFLDIAMSSYDGFYIFFNDGTGHFPTFSNTSLPNLFETIRAIDVNDDGIDEVIGSFTEVTAMPPFYIPNIRVLTSSGDGHLNEIYHKQFFSPIFSISGIDGYDINEDGLIDLIFKIGVNSVGVCKGLPDGKFDEPETFITNSNSFSFGPYLMQLADMNNDSKIDVVGFGAMGIPVIIHPNTTTPPVVTTEPTDLNVMAGVSEATITLTKGDGTGRIILVRKVSDNATAPVDDTFYKASTVFGQGDKVGESHVVLRGNKESVTVTGLDQETEFVVNVFEYSSNNTTRIHYMTTGPSKSFKTKKEQTITFNNTSGLVIDGDDLTVTASASSELPVELSVMSGSGLVADNTFTPDKAGKIKLHATQAGNSEYAPTEADIVFCVSPVKPTISISSGGLVILTSSSDDDNKWFSEPSHNQAGSGKTFIPSADGIYNLVTAVGECSNSSDNTESIVVGPESRVTELGVVAGENTAEISFIKGAGDGRLITIRRSGEAMVVPTNGIFYQSGIAFGTDQELASVSGLTPSTDYIVTIYEYYTNGTTAINYSTASASRSFTTLDPPVISFSATDNIELGTDNITVTASSSSGLPVELSIISGDGEVAGDTFTATVAGIVTLHARQAGNSEHTLVETEVSFCVIPMKPEVSISTGGIKTLTSSTDGNNSWFVAADDAVLATGKTFVPVFDGRFRVEVDVDGCVNSSTLTDSLFVGPITKVSNLEAHPAQTSAVITFQKGDGDGRLIIIYEVTDAPVVPTNGTFYDSKSAFSTELETVTFNKLDAATEYIVDVYEYYSMPSKNVINYSHSAATVKFNTLTSQTIAFSSTSNIVEGEGTDVTATASSNLPVKITILAGTGIVEGNKFIPATAGIIELLASQEGNSIFSAGSAVVQFCVYPPVPTLTLTQDADPIFTSSSDANIVWYVDNAVIPDANQITYMPKKEGAYKVSVDIEGCINVSEEINFVITGLEDELEDSVTLYPNPAKEFVRISLPDNIKTRPLVFNTMGQRFNLPSSLYNEGLQIDVSELTPGLYFAKIQNITLKFIKR